MFGTDSLSAQTRARLTTEVEAARRHEAELAALDGAAFQETLLATRVQLRTEQALRFGQATPARPRVMALLMAASVRSLGLAPTSQQIMAALAMHEGYVADLGPGQGKTLAVALAALLMAWSGRVCHVITANDFLALRDCTVMQALFALCHCTAAKRLTDTPEAELAQVYAADIVYATAKQLLADCMRDEMRLEGATDSLRRNLWRRRAPKEARQPLTVSACVALVDDVDQGMVDEATSPLIISATGSYSVLEEASLAARDMIEAMQPGRDYLLDDEPPYGIVFTESGERYLTDHADALPAFWQQPRRAEDIVTLAILARDLFRRDRHYVVHDNRVVIIDENIHRLLGGRMLQFGALQAIEAREGLPLSVPPRTVARTALQDFFPRYHRLAGTGSLLNDIRHELGRLYGLRVVTLDDSDTANQLRHVRRDFATRAEKRAALIETACELHRDQKPVLIATQRMLDTAEVAMQLAQRNIAFVIIEGRDVVAEMQALHQAGQAGRVTLLTGAAGRGIEIPVPDEVSAAGGLQILLLDHFDTQRADRLFFMRAARRGGAGTAFTFDAMDDPFFAHSLPFWARPLTRLSAYPAMRACGLRLLTAIMQSRARRQAVRHRRLISLREQQLDQQLAFSRKH